MRAFSVILLTYVILLLVVPTVCNSMMQCSKEQSNNKTSKDNKMSCESCCSVQNCHCSFTGIQKFDFQIQASIITKKIHPQNDNVLSTYLSECWHPPEII